MGKVKAGRETRGRESNDALLPFSDRTKPEGFLQQPGGLIQL